MASVLKTIIKLRRDDLLNYAKPGAWTHVPEKGEVCFVDTLSGLRVKVGDGSSTFGNLPYADSMILQGYYKKADGKFYKESTFATELEGSENILYIDKLTNVIYYYNGVSFIANEVILPGASADKAGVLKLYSVHGQNEDGTMTQKAITDAISAIVFDIEEGEGEDADNALILNKP